MRTVLQSVFLPYVVCQPAVVAQPVAVQPATLAHFAVNVDMSDCFNLSSGRMTGAI